MRHALLLAAALMAPVAAAAETHTTPRADGSAIHWHLDLPPAAEPVALVVLLQGSGCESVATSANLAEIRAAFAGFAALSLEKRGVPPGFRSDAARNNADCPEEFHAHAGLAQRIADHVGVVAELGDAPWWNGRLVLFGGSEGGLAAAALAAPLGADAVVLLSTGGGLSFGETIRLTVPEPGRPSFDAQLAAVLADPEGETLWAGYRPRFWADMLGRRAVDDMLAADTAFLLVQGGADVSSPVAGARASADAFAAAGRCTLTYWELAGLDHGMVSRAGEARLADVAGLAAIWVDRQLADPPADCTGS